MEHKTGYTIKIQNFEGPLDLLFHLIEKNKMDIYDIQIGEITDQYLEFLGQMERIDLEIASEFLVMASTLLLIKSRMLLPKPQPPDEDTDELRDQLINSLLEYKKYKEYALELKNREAYYGKMFYKPQEVFKVLTFDIINKSYPSEVIPEIYADICIRNIKKLNPRKEIINQLIVKEKITIRSKIKEIVKFLFDKTKFKFSELFVKGKDSKMDIVTSFMAILELAKIKKLTIEQKEGFGDIVVKKTKNSDIIKHL
ncbi:MAG: segregation and condensation protein A [Ignavibacteriales bacterium]